MEQDDKVIPCFEWLPAELVQHVFRFLDASNLVCMSGVCKTFNTVQQDETIWRQLFQNRWPIICQAVTGTQSRWDFRSKESKIFLYFMERANSTTSSTKVQDHLSGESSSDEEGWAMQKNRKKIRVTEISPLNSPSMTSKRDDDSEEARASESDSSGNEEDLDLLKDKERRWNLEETRYEVQCLVCAMKAFPRITRLQKEICYVFRRLCYQPTETANHQADVNQKLIAAEDGIQLLLDLVREFPLDAGIQMEASAALINLALNDENKETIAQLGGIHLVVVAMRNHASDVNIQQFCCSVLWNLACNDTNKDIIAKESGIQLVLETMRRHSGEPKLQAKACGALRNIARNHEANRIIIVKEGGLHLIMKAVRLHEHVPTVQSEACRTLYNIARNIGDEGLITEGLQLIMKIMRTHKENPHVQYEACMALAGLSYRDNRDLTNGGIQLVMEAMKLHDSNPEIQKIGAAVLADLSLNANNEQFIVRAGGLNLILAALKRHQKNVQLQETLLSVLADLTRKAPQTDCVVTEGGVEVILAALQNFPHSENVSKFGVATLKNLATFHTNGRLEIAEKGGLKYLM